MVTRSKKFHEYFEVSTIENKLRELSPGLLLGKYPAAFSRELITKWQYGEPPLHMSPSKYVARVSRDDIPEILQQGFGPYYGAVMTPRSVIMFHFPDQLQEYLEHRLLDVRDSKGEFADKNLQ